MTVLEPVLLINPARFDTKDVVTHSNVAWQNYYWLLIRFGSYGNWQSTVFIPTSVFAGSNQGRRPEFIISNVVDISVWQNGNNSICIQSSDANSIYEVGIYGVGAKV